MRNKAGIELKKGYYVWGRYHIWGTNQYQNVEGVVTQIKRGGTLTIALRNGKTEILRADEVTQVLPPMRIEKDGTVKANPLQRVKVTSRSQATGRPPTKRLRERRKKTDAMPIPGIWANPPTEARELWLFALNDSFVYPKSRRAHSGDPTMPWTKVAEIAAREYSEQFGNGSRQWKQIFNDNDIKVVASMLRKHYAENGEFDDYAENPLSRTTPYADSQRERAGQMGPTKSPSRRLVKRRKYTEAMPEGFYANPASDFPYHVEMEFAKSGAFVRKASFADVTDAKKHARALAKQYPSRTIRVMSDVKKASKWLK